MRVRFPSPAPLLYAQVRARFSDTAAVPAGILWRVSPHTTPPQAPVAVHLDRRNSQRFGNRACWLTGSSRNGSEISSQRLPLPSEQVMAAIAGWLSAAR